MHVVFWSMVAIAVFKGDDHHLGRVPSSIHRLVELGRVAHWMARVDCVFQVLLHVFVDALSWVLLP